MVLSRGTAIGVRQLQQWIFSRRMALVLLSCIVIYNLVQPSAPIKIDWADPNWMKEIDRCQSTKIKPFRVGCPASCDRAIGNETMYRMGVEWYFGQPILFDESELPNAYDKGINYQCPRQFVENFIEASKRLGEEAKANLPNNITVKSQRRMHMSLAYMCCLRKNETNWVREIVHDWINANRPFDFTVRFNKLECWHERFNSVTNIIVGDNATQQTVLKIVRSLYKAIEARGIPLNIKREHQMPIHSTLVGVHYGEGEGQQKDDIRPYLAAIHEIVAPISKKYGNWWTGRVGRMRIRHDPVFSVKGAWHAGAKAQ